MAYAFSTTYKTAGTPVLTAASASVTSSGNFLGISVNVFNGVVPSTPTDTYGNTWTAVTGSPLAVAGNTNVYAWYSQNATTGVAHIFTVGVDTLSTYSFSVIGLSGRATSSAIDGTQSSAESSAVTSHTGPSITPTVAGTDIVVLFGDNNASTNQNNDSWTAGASLTLPVGGYNPDGRDQPTTGVMYQENVGTSAISTAFTSSSTQAGFFVLAVKEPAAGTSIDTIDSPLAVGSTGNAITTTGLGTLTTLTFGSGKSCVSISAPSGDGTFAMPAFSHGVTYPAMGTQTFIAGDGTLTASTTSSVATMSGYTAVTMGTMNTGVWSIGKDPAIVTGDVVHLPTAAGTLNTDGTLTEYVYGTYTMWRRDVSDGTMYTSTLTVSNLSIIGVYSTAYAGDMTAYGKANASLTGVYATTSVGTLTASVVQDTTPTQFTFDDVYGAELTTDYPSNDITVSGIVADTNTAITISGVGEYAINTGSGYGAYTTDAGNVQLGDLVRVTLTSSGSYETVVSTVLTIGGVSDTYTVTTATESSGGFQGTVTRNVTSGITP